MTVPHMTRHCATGQHWQPTDRFRRRANGVLSRDCTTCEDRRRRLRNLLRGRPNMNTVRGAPCLPTREFPGVDIDAIHHKRGAVRK